MKKAFKILILLSLFFNLSVLAKEVRLIHITDIDLTKENAYKLQRTIKEINMFKDIDFVVFGGNNIAKADIENLNTFLYLVKKTKKKSYVLLGNNDVLSSSGVDKNFYMNKVALAEFRHSDKSN